MSFEEELQKRTAQAKEKTEQQEKDRAAAMRKARKQQQLILETKELVNSLFNKVIDHYPNASIEKTHDVNPDGEMTPYMGTFKCCFLNFNANQNYEFPVPARFAIEIHPSDDLYSVKLVSDFAYGKNSQQTEGNVYKQLLDALRKSLTTGNHFYNGPFNKQDMQEAVQAEIIKLLDGYKDAIKNLPPQKRF